MVMCHLTSSCRTSGFGNAANIETTSILGAPSGRSSGQEPSARWVSSVISQGPKLHPVVLPMSREALGAEPAFKHEGKYDLTAIVGSYNTV